MSWMRPIQVLAAAACALTACSAPAPHVNSLIAKEQAAVAPLKSKYKDVITGLDVKDRTLIMYVEPNAMSSMDEDAEAAMKADALHRWQKAWTGAHPHQHGKLSLSVRDYFGREISTQSVNV
jgi:hypothetical protein